LTLKEGLTTRSGTTVSGLGISGCLANHEPTKHHTNQQKRNKPKTPTPTSTRTKATQNRNNTPGLNVEEKEPGDDTPKPLIIRVTILLIGLREQLRE